MPPAPTGLSLAEPGVPWHGEMLARICPSVQFAGTSCPVLSGSPVQLVHELLHGCQVGIPDLLYQGDVVLQQDLGGTSSELLAPGQELLMGAPVGAWAGL